MQIIRYNPTLKDEWNRFVAASRNGTFLMDRDYMDYHADRFTDHSLLFYHKNRIRCILPANESAGVFYTHQGLTYGGMIFAGDTRSEEIETAFTLLMVYLRELGFRYLNYKPVPSIYHGYPSMEDLYFLFRHDAKRIACALAATIYLPDRIPYSRERRRAVTRGGEMGIKVCESEPLHPFWKVMEANMAERFGAVPVHTHQEMALLRDRFPDNIRLFGAFDGGELLAGALIYDTGWVVRIQYGHASPRGKALGALDVVYDHLIRLFEKERTYLDFGQCTEENGRVLNAGLIHQKEGFGGRGTLYETYQLQL